MFEGLERSSFECGYDNRFKEEATLLIMDRIKDAYINGYKQAYISKQLHEELGMNQYATKMLSSKCWKELVTENKKRSEGMLEKNLARLEKIYNDAMDNNDPKSALSAIEIMNKLCQLYTQKVEVTAKEYTLDFGE